MSYQDKNLTCHDCNQYPSLLLVMATDYTRASSAATTGTGAARS